MCGFELSWTRARVSSWNAARAALGRLVAIALGATSQVNCLYYDSTWGQAKTAQQNAAQHYSGAQLGEKSGAQHRLPPKKPAARRVRIVALATPEHAAQVVHWQQRFAEAVERANQVLSPVVGLELELADAGVWRPSSHPDDLSAQLHELERDHPASSEEWVIGLVGALARLESSFHQLGVATLHGKHVIMRAANDAAEYDAIERAYTELSAEERAALYRSRRAHQASAVLIHELGHCLGAVHVNEPTDLMHATYNTEMSSMAAPVAAVMRITLEQATLPAQQQDARALLARIDPELEREEAHWDAEEVRQMRAYLQARAASTPEAAAPPTAVVAAPDASAAPASTPSNEAAAAPAIEGLTEPEQQLYQRALNLKIAGRLFESAETAAPLFRDHSSRRPVAELRCQLAMERGLDWQQTRTECAPLLAQTSEFGR